MNVIHVRITFLECTGDWGEHHGKSLGIRDAFVFGREQKLVIEQEADTCGQSFLAEALVQLVEKTYILVGNTFFGAFFAFADVVVCVGEPYVKAVHVRMSFRVFDDMFGQTGDDGWIGEVKTGKDRRSVDEIACAVD